MADGGIAKRSELSAVSCSPLALNEKRRTAMKTMQQWRGVAAVLAAIGWLGFAGGLLGITGCAEEPVKPEAALDTPEHHYSTGIRLVDRDDYDGAMKEFQRAVALDP